MFISLPEQRPLNMDCEYVTAATGGDCPPTAEVFQRIPGILNQCFKFLVSEERARAALVDRQFNRAATQYFKWPVTQLYGPPMTEIGLPFSIFKDCLGFVGLDKKDLQGAICANRAWQQNTIEYAIDCYSQPIIHFCELLALQEAPTKGLCTFRGFDSWQDLHRRISEIKKKVIIQLSRLGYAQQKKLLDLCKEDIPIFFENVFDLALERTELLGFVKRGCWTYAVSESFKDDEELVFLFIKHSILDNPENGYHSFELASERLQNKESFVIRVIREVMPHYHPDNQVVRMSNYVNERLSGDVDFMSELLQYYPAAIDLASEELTNNSCFMHTISDDDEEDIDG